MVKTVTQPVETMEVMPKPPSKITLKRRTNHHLSLFSPREARIQNG